MKCCYIKEWFVLGVCIMYFVYRLDEMLLSEGLVCLLSLQDTIFCTGCMKCCYIKEWFVLGLCIMCFVCRLDEMLLTERASLQALEVLASNVSCLCVDCIYIYVICYRNLQ